jgi:hypothetical protein
MMQLDLRLGPRQCRCTLICRCVPMFVDAIQQRRARLCRHRPEGNAHCGAGRHSNATAQCEDRIEHRSDRIGQRSGVQHRNRRADAVSTAEEARPIGFELRLADGFAVGDAQMRRPNFGFRGSALSPGREDRAEIGKILGLDEQFREGWMRDIGAPWS